MIDLMENKVLAPILQERYEQGAKDGEQNLLRDLLAAKFGQLPNWAVARLTTASSEELHRWTLRGILRFIARRDPGLIDSPAA